MSAAARSTIHYLLLAVTCVLLLRAVLPVETEAHGDTTRDLLMARDCRTGDICPMAGPDTSYPGVRQSALWPVHLAVLQALDVSIDNMHVISVGLLVLALLLLAIVGEHLGGRTLGLSAALAAALLHLPATYWVPLWNPTFMLLPATAFFGAIFIAVRHELDLAWLGAAFFLALAIELHPIAMLLAVALPWGFVLHPPRHPLRTGLLGTGLLVASLYAFFRDAWLALGREIRTGAFADSLDERAEHVVSLGLVIVVALVVLAVLFGLWQLRKRVPAVRERLSGGGIALALTFLSPGVLALLVLMITDRFYGYRYLVAPLPGLVLAGVLALRPASRWVQERLPVPAALVAWGAPLLPLLVVLAWQGPFVGPRQMPGSWTYRDGESIAGTLEARGLTHFDSALSRLQALDPDTLSFAVRPYLRSGGQTDAMPAQDFLIAPLAMPAEQLPDGWLARTRPNGSSVVVMPMPRALDWTRAEARILARIEDVLPFVPVALGGYESTYAPWLRPTGEGLASMGRVLEVRVPMVGGFGTLRMAALPDCRCPEAKARIVHVHGARATGSDQRASVLGPSPVGWALAEWRYPDSCLEITPETARPGIIAWPADDDETSRLVESMVCP